ncbi:MAG: histidine kinase [Actinomycetia bacterium]|nr:histidine kinase [Actinomycetes bacterium]
MERPVESAGDLSDTALRAAVDAASDGILVVDDDGTVVFANPMLRHLFGYAGPELIGCPIELLIPDHLQGAHGHHRRGYTNRPRTRPMGSGLELHGRHRDGHEFPVEIGLSPVEVGGTVHVIAVVRDVTDRRLVAEDLAHAQEQLALVDDRERIARDLHDTVIQRLFAVGLSLQGALVRADTSDLSGRLETAIDEIDGTIRDIRTSIFALQSRRGLAAGPRETVLQLAREAARALGFDPRIEFRGLIDTKMTDDIREQFVPTLREALTNVAKHAGASRVEVSVEVEDDVLLRVTDNGVGVPADHSHSAGSGLANMAERAEQLGGTCIIKGAERGGTVIEWQVPIDRGG